MSRPIQLTPALAEMRGRAAGESDPEPCELAPADCMEHYDAWLRAYRAAWKRRAARS